jgi:hypothetical protein
MLNFSSSNIISARHGAAGKLLFVVEQHSSNVEFMGFYMVVG